MVEARFRGRITTEAKDAQQKNVCTSSSVRDSE